MKAAIITVAGISSRFNQGVPACDRQLKAIYTDGDVEKTLLYRLVQKCGFAQKIIVVGGYRFQDLEAYCAVLEQRAPELKERLELVYNPHYEDLGSGYSLYLGIEAAMRYPVEEILFVEGDLDVDGESFARAAAQSGDVLTYNYEPIYANKAVVLYQDGQGRYHYAFNSSHGLLSLSEPFACVLNSGQLWKFTDMPRLWRAAEQFCIKEKEGTNLRIIQNYLDGGTACQLVGLRRWTNCNTRQDYERIMSFWEGE